MHRIQSDSKEAQHNQNGFTYIVFTSPSSMFELECSIFDVALTVPKFCVRVVKSISRELVVT